MFSLMPSGQVSQHISNYFLKKSFLKLALPGQSVWSCIFKSPIFRCCLLAVILSFISELHGIHLLVTHAYSTWNSA